MRSRCRCALKNAFLFRLALHELKKTALFRKTKGFRLQKAWRFALKSLSFSQPKHRYSNNFLLSSKTAFLCAKSLLFAQVFHCWFQKPPIFTNQKPCFYPNFFLFPPKATLFCPPSPIRTTLNLLFAKNTAVLLISALTPYAVKPEPHTDSNHCRRYPKNCSFLRCRLPDERRTFQKKSRIDRRFESSPESRGSQTSGVLFGSFCTTQKE